LCGGLGWISVDVPVGHPQFGRLLPCPHRQAETAGVVSQKLWDALGPLRHMTLENFTPEGHARTDEQRNSLRNAYEGVKRFVSEPRGWLFLQGGYGCGKTHLAAAIANDRLERGESVLFVIVPDLLDHLRAAFAPTSRVSYDDRFEAVRSTPFLILDDLGAQAATEWAQEKLFQLLNYRYNAQLPTVITTNRQFEELEPRIRSRLADREFCKVVSIKGHDYRHGGDSSDNTAISNLAMYSYMTFEEFDLRTGELQGEARGNLQRIFNSAKGYAENPVGFIVFTGEYGCGKTHLAAAIANAIHRRGQEALIVVVPDLLDHLRATFAPDSRVSYDRRFEDTRTARFLVLDDLGTENATPWAREKLFQIIDYRYVSRLPTVITMHRKAQIDERIMTRVFDLARGSVNEITAPSYRTADSRAQSRPEQATRKRGYRERN
jgi:DNA replication protein DnaC